MEKAEKMIKDQRWKHIRQEDMMMMADKMIKDESAPSGRYDEDGQGNDQR